MILSTAKHFIEAPGIRGWVHAEAELPSGVVQVFIERTENDPKPVLAMQTGLTFDAIDRYIDRYTAVDGGNVELFNEIHILKQRIAANHVFPNSGRRFQCPCLCGDLYAAIDGPCSACEVVKDFALELGLLEVKVVHPSGKVLLFWTESASFGGHVEMGAKGWDWERRPWIEMRDENVYSSIVVDVPTTAYSVPPGHRPIVTSRSKAERRRAKKLRKQANKSGTKLGGRKGRALKKRKR